MPAQPHNTTQQRPGAAWAVRAIAVSLVVGLLLVGWYVLPPLWPSLMPLGTGVSLFDGERIGRPATAPVVRSCIAKVMGLGSDTNAEPSALYFVLEIGSLQAGARSILGVSDGESEAELNAGMALQWGQLANCIYAREGRALCDRDNRAAAVETLTKFILHANRATQSPQKTGSVTGAATDVQRQIEAIKSRLLSALGTHWRDGVFVPSDFGFFAPTEISKVMQDEKITRNVCGS